MRCSHNAKLWLALPWKSVNIFHNAPALHAKQPRRKLVSRFSFTCNKHPPQSTNDKSNDSSMREGNPLEALNWFQRLYELHTPKSVGRDGQKLGFVWSPLFFSLRAASRLSWVGWFSPALAFRSLYYPCGKMGTTRNLHKVSKRLLRLLLGTTKTTDKCGTQFGSSSFLPSKVANWRPSKSLV